MNDDGDPVNVLHGGPMDQWTLRVPDLRVMFVPKVHHKGATYDRIDGYYMRRGRLHHFDWVKARAAS